MLRNLLIKLALFGTRQSPARAVGVPGWQQWLIGRPFALPEESLVFPEAYKRIPDVFAAISLIQSTISSLPLNFYHGDTLIERTGDRVPRNVADLWGLANPEDTGTELIEQIVGSMEINGTGYLFLEFLGTQEIQELWVLPGHAIEPIPGKNRSVQAYKLNTAGGEEVIIPGEQIVPFKHYNPDHGVIGLSPLMVAQMAYYTQRDAARWLRAFYQRGATISGYFSTETAISDQSIERLQEEMRKRYAGPGAAFKPVILPRGLKFERQGLTQEEMQFLDTANLTTSDILRIFKIPPVLLGVKEGGGLSDAGASTDMLLFWENCIRPRTRRIESVINERLLIRPEFGRNVRAEFDFSNVMPLQAVMFMQAKSLAEATGGPVMTRAEARKQLDLPDLEDPSLEQLLTPIAMATDLDFDEDLEAAAMRGAQGSARATDGPSRATDSRAVRREVAHARITMHERMGLVLARRLFRQQLTRVLKALELQDVRAKRFIATRVIDIDELLKDEDADRRLLRRLIRAVLAEAGRSAIESIAEELTFNLNAEVVRRYLNERPDRGLKLINATTRRRLRDSLGEGVEANESHEQLVARVRQVYRVRLAQARTVARTEVVSSYNFASREAYEQSGVVEELEWLTARDELVRPEHEAADGQVVPLGTPFNVGGEQLDFPGDPVHGSAAMTINCRCTTLPIVRKTEGRKNGKPTISLEEMFRQFEQEEVAT